MEYDPGALVSARGRNWVVLPPDLPEILRLRSLDGAGGDEIGILPAFEPDAVTSASFPAPDPQRSVDSSGLRLLFDAARLQLRSGAGPFRSLGRIAVAPRPYQLVPLLMALRLDPVRLLIADDVGVGKTIEAGLIARELLDRGQIGRIGVLCPPHLLGQWEAELSEKFGIDATVIASSQIARLERELPRPGISVFGYHRHLIASIDLVKADRYRGFFIQHAPDLIIVDEAHTAVSAGAGQGIPQQQRHRLIRELAAEPDRHLVMATATPHSGIEAGFRSLLGLLDPEFDKPDEEKLPRRRVARHFVQRKRPDVERWLGADTPFPKRDSREIPYQMTPEYVRLYERVRDYLQEFVATAEEGNQNRRRVRYWAATAILRCLLSSPAAAEATIAARRSRRSEALEDSDSGISADAIPGQAAILDSADEEEASDYVPTSAVNDPDLAFSDDEIARLDRFLFQARRLRGKERDAKLTACAHAVGQMLKDGFNPIVYCRFVPTAEYVAEGLSELLAGSHRGLQVRSVTGADGDSEQRKEIVTELAGQAPRVLVATDCLSEGINLQEDFDAVLHYDLPWNPNRLEQREGRVDRYGQPKETVRTGLLYGSNNAVDLTVLGVLIRKARAIREQWGFAVPVPNSDAIVQAVIDGVLERRPDQAGLQLALTIEGEAGRRFQEQLDEAARRDELTRSIFAQHSIKPDQIARELAELEPALGSARDLERFYAEALPRFGGWLRGGKDGVARLSFGDLRQGLVERVDALPENLRVKFSGPFPGDPSPLTGNGAISIGRCDPITGFLAESVMSKCLAEAPQEGFFGRGAAIATRAVTLRCMILVLRLRFLLTERGSPPTFAEEVLVRGLRREPGQGLIALSDEEAFNLLRARADGNLALTDRSRHLEWALAQLELDRVWQERVAGERTRALKAAHERLRGQIGGNRLKVEPHLPPDILGALVLVPALD